MSQAWRKDAAGAIHGPTASLINTSVPITTRVNANMRVEGFEMYDDGSAMGVYSTIFYFLKWTVRVLMSRFGDRDGDCEAEIADQAMDITLAVSRSRLIDGNADANGDKDGLAS